MEYTVQKLGKIAGISTRTLRYYDEIDILKPARINSSGYRIYGKAEVDRLQQILFYRELGVSLEERKSIFAASSFDVLKALRGHRDRLLEKREQLDLLIENVNKTIAEREGGIKMSDTEKFEGFKKKLVDDNEKQYGKENREKYGNEAVKGSNDKLLNMTQEEFDRASALEKEVLDTLQEAFKTGKPEGELAQKAADLHRQWLSLYWDSYTKEAHAGVVQMYTSDERFKAYYDREPGMTEFLKDAVLVYTAKQT
ncbi:DNA-binding transcriptional MerR regulator [Anaerobacterium chartisolvens]|uniref:DNA-binding transcriptional MerR regulator n=1 Tax=Anaerobacterium chartisolvens TaxID=1297424 RepID=A0A369ATP3_9FIRM|nr:MerR family transcriptional regulator [Anaerobacterium chartisolvens]RCX12709.1 DNA-binding transcriptional MerR regulator [Anaerobacterium chartisolvens]